MLPWVTELFNASEFKAQQKHNTLCYTSGYYCHEQGSNSKYSCQIPLFFQQELLTGNTVSSFSALIQHSQRQTQQSVMPRYHSRSSPTAKFPLFLMGEGRLGSHWILTVQLPFYVPFHLRTYTAIHSILSPHIPILSSSVFLHTRSISAYPT